MTATSWRIVIDFARGLSFSANYEHIEQDEAVYRAITAARDAGVDAFIERILVVRIA